MGRPVDPACLLTFSLVRVDFDFGALTHLCFSVALSMYILVRYSTCWLWFLGGHWQNSHKFLLESVRLLKNLLCVELQAHRSKTVTAIDIFVQNVCIGIKRWAWRQWIRILTICFCFDILKIDWCMAKKTDICLFLGEIP